VLITYVGVFFEMITTDMRRTPPQTIQELIDLNYTFYAMPDERDVSKPDPKVLEWTKNYKG
jgi:hypothetical protein